MATVMLLCFAASAVGEDYMTFKPYGVYKTEKPLDAVPATYEAWVRIPEGKTKASGIVLGNYRGGTYNSFQFHIYDNSAPMIKFVNKVPNSVASSKTYTFTNSTVATGEWVHVAIVADTVSKTISCYVNGSSITLEQCMNTGAVSANGKYVGGIVGYWRVYSASANKCTLQDCINTAPVYAAQTAVGGIMGTGNGQNYAFTLTRCFNSGSITAGGSAYIRPIAGAISKATYNAGQMTYCYYSSADSYTTDATGYSAANETYVADITAATSFEGFGENWVLVDGYAPELKVFHEHDYKYVSVGGEHKYACYCGDLSSTVYVSENGKELADDLEGEIGTSTNPFKHFADAMQYAAYSDKDVTVTILDNAEVPKDYITPEFTATITITGGTLETNNRFVLSGNIVFENIHIKNNVALVIAAHENKLVMGEGITISGDTYLVGGYESGLDSNADIPATGYSTDITIRSGRYHSVGGGNRFLDGKYSGTIKMTIGKTNPADTLEFYSTLVTGSLNYDGGDGVFATVVFDGNVDSIETYRPIGHAAAGVQGRFDVDVAVQGHATIGIGTADLRGHDYTINVYADDRVEGAEEFAANIVGADKVQPYKRYCLKINGEHPDANGDTACDNCGAPIVCEHESGEWMQTSAANCASVAVYTWYCLDCKELIEDITKNGEKVDPDNHVSADNAWKYADGKYFFGCTACGTVTEQDTLPVLYVSSNGNDDYDGTTADKAVATVEEAVSRMANVGGTVMIVGSYTVSEDIVLPTYSNPITFSGYDAEDGYIVGGFKLSSLTVISLGGKTKFDNISFDGNTCCVFECNWNDVEFGKIMAVNNVYSHVVVGGYKITESDHEQKEVTLSITEGASSIISKEGVYSKNKFYTNIYLGSSFAKDGIFVSNKTVTFDATDADIGLLYTMSTSSTYKNNPVSNCETTVNLYGRTVIEKGRTGDFNVRYAESSASLSKQTLNFFDNSYVSMDYYIRNAEDTVINVSAEKDGREVSMVCPFIFYAYGTFANENTPVNVEINYSTHSFALNVDAPCVFDGKANDLKAYTENKTDECVYISKVTSEATPTQSGTILYSCTCGRCYTEEYDYSCADATHVYLAKDGGGYECTVCGERFASYSGDNTFAAAVKAVEENEMTVSLKVSGSFAAALVNISIPDGFTFGEAPAFESEDFIITGSKNGGVYAFVLLSKDGTANKADFEFEVVCTGAGIGNVEVTVPELYDGEGNSLVATTVSTEIPDEIILGDIDGNGVVTVLDALMLIKSVVNNTYVVNGDINGDGNTGLADAIRIFKLITK